MLQSHYIYNIWTKINLVIEIDTASKNNRKSKNLNEIIFMQQNLQKQTTYNMHIILYFLLNKKSLVHKTYWALNNEMILAYTCRISTFIIMLISVLSSKQFLVDMLLSCIILSQSTDEQLCIHFFFHLKEFKQLSH